MRIWQASTGETSGNGEDSVSPPDAGTIRLKLAMHKQADLVLGQIDMLAVSVPSRGPEMRVSAGGNPQSSLKQVGYKSAQRKEPVEVEPTLAPPAEALFPVVTSATPSHVVVTDPEANSDGPTLAVPIPGLITEAKITGEPDMITPPVALGGTNRQPDGSTLENLEVVGGGHDTLTDSFDSLQLAIVSQREVVMDLVEPSAEVPRGRRRAKRAFLGAFALSAAMGIGLHSSKHEENTSTDRKDNVEKSGGVEEGVERRESEEMLRLTQQLKTDLEQVQPLIKDLYNPTNEVYDLERKKNRESAPLHPLTLSLKRINQNLGKLGISCVELDGIITTANCSVEAEALQLDVLRENIELIKAALGELEVNEDMQALNTLLPPAKKRCKKMLDRVSSKSCPNLSRQLPRRELGDYRELAKVADETRVRLGMVVGFFLENER